LAAAGKARDRLIHAPQTQGITVNKPNPPRHQPEIKNKGPLSLKADIKKPTKSDFFNNLSHKRTYQTVELGGFWQSYTSP